MPTERPPLLGEVVPTFARRCKLDSSGAEKYSATGSCEYGNEPCGSVKDEEFLDQLSDY
jgi:hypothetical protein